MLTPKQLSILQRLGDGMTLRSAAAAEGISEDSAWREMGKAGAALLGNAGKVTLTGIRPLTP